MGDKWVSAADEDKRLLITNNHLHTEGWANICQSQDFTLVSVHICGRNYLRFFFQLCSNVKTWVPGWSLGSETLLWQRTAMLDNHLPPEATVAACWLVSNQRGVTLWHWHWHWLTALSVFKLTPRSVTILRRLPRRLCYVWPIITAALAVRWPTGGPGVSSPSLRLEPQRSHPQNFSPVLHSQKRILPRFCRCRDGTGPGPFMAGGNSTSKTIICKLDAETMFHGRDMILLCIIMENGCRH